MELLLEFLSQQWMLAAALVVLLLLLFMHESRKGAKSLTPQQVSNQINQHNAVIVDLRDKAEFKAGHIVDAISIPHAQLAGHLADIEKYKDKPVVLVCKHGQHAGASSKLLKASGFEQVFKLGGGITEWQASQLPLVRK